MMIRTFEADTLRAAMKKVRAQLGQDAMILRTREVLATGPHQAVRYEVTARGSETDSAERQDTTEQDTTEQDTEETSSVRLQTHAGRTTDTPRARRGQSRGAQAGCLLGRDRATGWNDLEGRLDAAIGSLHAEVVQLGRHLQSAFRGVTGSDPLTRGLITAGVEPRIASAIVNRARAKVAPQQGVALAAPPNILDEIQSMLTTAPPLWDSVMDNDAGPLTARLRRSYRAWVRHEPL